MQFSEVVEKLSPAIKAHSLTGQPDSNPAIQGVAAIDEAVVGQLSYIEGTKFAGMITKTAASALILPLDETLQAQATAQGIAWIATADPRLLFAQVIRLFYQPFQPAPQIHPTAVIDPSVVLGQDIYIGPYVVIYPGAKIGDRVILHANCTIHERVQMGKDCVIHSGAVIGAEGFGFVPTADGWLKMEQSGYVVLEDGVEIGCNSTVDRPAVGETRIGQNTKLDNLVHIAHGCQIGKNCAMAAQVGLAGGVKIGDRVILAGQVGVANQAKIGDGAIASAQTGIHNDVAPGEIVSSSPAVPHKIYLKSSAIYKRLPEIYQTVKQLQKQLAELQKK